METPPIFQVSALSAIPAISTPVLAIHEPARGLNDLAQRLFDDGSEGLRVNDTPIVGRFDLHHGILRGL